MMIRSVIDLWGFAWWRLSKFDVANEWLGSRRQVVACFPIGNQSLLVRVLTRMSSLACTPLVP
ncbi:MAG: hypothetical protein ACPGPS_19075 [Rubripirellula sp.]